MTVEVAGPLTVEQIAEHSQCANDPDQSARYVCVQGRHRHLTHAGHLLVHGCSRPSAQPCAVSACVQLSGRCSVTARVQHGRQVRNKAGLRDLRVDVSPQAVSSAHVPQQALPPRCLTSCAVLLPYRFAREAGYGPQCTASLVEVAQNLLEATAGGSSLQPWHTSTVSVHTSHYSIQRCTEAPSWGSVGWQEPYCQQG